MKIRKRPLGRFLFEISPVLGYLGVILIYFSFLFLIPLIVDYLYLKEFVSLRAFILPASLSFVFGFLLKVRLPLQRINHKQGMLIAALSWIVVSLIGSLPYMLGFHASFIDSFFETVSGFTTTGITMFSNLDIKSRSILFYRALTQWVGGLGILSFALLIIYQSGVAPELFAGESHKIRTKRITPGLFNTVMILWVIYVCLTFLLVFLLKIEGLNIFDAVTHSFTTLSTGGFSTHDMSIGYYSAVNYPLSNIIEWTIILFMLFGGMNFLVHYRILQGDVKALWDSFEIKLFWLFICSASGIIILKQFTDGRVFPPDLVRSSIFQVVSIMTTTGYSTRDIAAPIYGGVSKQIFLFLMVIGGCIGSTAGGLKVLRIGILFKLMKFKILSLVYPSSAVGLIMVDRNKMAFEEVRRVSSLFVAWMFLLAVGGLITAFFSNHGALESFSGMASALGNVGPCYISGIDMTNLSPVIKFTYIVGMFAGRLEILPILMLFYKNTWR
jgi:trk system potassium uptake protein TrkH